MEARRGRSPCESCEPEEPEQAADRTARSVLLRLWGEGREESCINLRYLAVPMALLHQTALLVRRVASSSPTVGTRVHVLHRVRLVWSNVLI